MEHRILAAGATRRRFLGSAATLLVLSALGLPVLSGAEAAAQGAPGIVLTPQNLADLARVEAYLNGIDTLQARFQQFSAQGGVVFGDIYIDRPGRMRVEYEPPVPVVLIADGILVSYHDTELDQLSQVPLSSTPAWFLLRKNISLTEGITITNLETKPGALRITMYQTKEPEAGSVDLIFADQPLELRQWKIIDPAGKEVRIGLFDVRLGGDLPNELFATPKVRKGGRRD